MRCKNSSLTAREMAALKLDIIRDIERYIGRLIVSAEKQAGIFEKIDAILSTRPEKGVDYWTDEDKAQIISEVLASMPVGEGMKF